MTKAARERNARGEGNLLRAEILSAVDRLVGDEHRIGPKWLSLREAAREAGVAAPSIYPHFANKDQLIESAITNGFDMLVEAMRSAARNASEQGATSTDALTAQARAYCQFADSHRGFFRLMFNLGPPIDENLGAAALFAQWVGATSELYARRAQTTASHKELALLIWSAVHGRITLGRALRTRFEELMSSIDILIAELDAPT